MRVCYKTFEMIQAGVKHRCGMWLPFRVAAVNKVRFRPSFHTRVKEQAFAEYFYVWLTFFGPALLLYPMVNTLP